MTAGNDKATHSWWSLAGVGVFLILFFYLIRLTASIYVVFLLGFFSILISIVMSFPVNWLARFLPRSLAVVITLLGMTSIVVVLGFFTVPLVTSQGKLLVDKIPDAAARVEQWTRRAQQSPAAPAFTGGKNIAETLKERVNRGVGELLSQAIPTAISAVELITTLILIVILAAFLVAKPESYRNGIRALFPKRHHSTFDEAWESVHLELRHWMGGILISMTIMGTLTATGLFFSGIEGSFVLGALTFFGTFIPYAGAIASAIPGLVIGLATSPQAFIYVAMVYLGIHVVEGYIVEPFVMRRAVELRPGLLLFWQLLMGAIFGVLGIVVATPLLVCLKVLTHRLYMERTLKQEEKQTFPVPKAS